MAKMKKSLSGDVFVESIPKKSRQGNGKHSKYSATSRNSARKRYRGQGKWRKMLLRGHFLMLNKYLDKMSINKSRKLLKMNENKGI